MNLTSPSTLCLFLLAAIVVLLLFRTRVRMARQQRRSAEEDQRAGTAGSSRPLPDDLAQWEVRMHETAREFSAQIDAKLSLLQSLIAEANHAAQRLEEALDRAYPALPPGSQAESLRPAADMAGASIAATETPGEKSDDAPVEPELSGNGDRARRREEIYQLADYGFAPADIAHRVGSPVGEVELILSLRGK